MDKTSVLAGLARCGLTISAGVLLLAGCAPESGTFYRVSSPEGKTRGYCSDLGPPVALELKRGPVVVVIDDIRDPIKPSINNDWFGVNIYIHSKSDVVKFPWDQLNAVDDVSGENIPLQVRLVSGANHGPHGITSEIQTGMTFDGSEHDEYTIEYVFAAAVGSKFHINVPEMWVNDVSYLGVAVRYEKDSGTFLRC